MNFSKKFGQQQDQDYQYCGCSISEFGNLVMSQACSDASLLPMHTYSAQSCEQALINCYFSSFWACDHQMLVIDKQDASLNAVQFEYNEAYPPCSQNEPASSHCNKTTSQRSSLPSIDTNLQKILELADNKVQLSFFPARKSRRGLHNGVSERRSRFIGVLKNRLRWQTLINEGRSKRYIGTYKSELEAAVAHDFYSIGINGITAKTNFSYDTEQVVEMINSYYDWDKSFQPSLFANRINFE